jgi:hypothetical protein
VVLADWLFSALLKETKRQPRRDPAQPQHDHVDLPELSLKILDLFGIHDRLNLSKIEELTGGNKNTLKVRLRELVNSGHISKHGKARATWYEKSTRYS